MKKNIGILFGGNTAEHEISIMSAKSVIENIDRDLFNIKIYGLDKKNTPYIFSEENFISKKENLFDNAEKLSWGSFTDIIISEVDVIFPILHGPYGEDGKIQGYFEMLNKKYVGCGLTSSAICMDKMFCKYVLFSNGFKMLPFTELRLHEYENNKDKSIKKILEKIKFPMFVKPCNMGSSVGISKANNENELNKSIQKAFEFDSVILVEHGIEPRELECGVIGFKELKATAVGEIVPSHEFYDYEAKYSEDSKSDLIIPADITKEEYDYIQNEAIRSCTVLNVRGLSRVDFLKDKKTGDIYLSEINTMPGFTKFSMYPSLAKEIGYSYKDLITELINISLI